MPAKGQVPAKSCVHDPRNQARHDCYHSGVVHGRAHEKRTWMESEPGLINALSTIMTVCFQWVMGKS